MNIAAIINLWNHGFDSAEIAFMLRINESEVWNTFARLDRAGLGKVSVPRLSELAAVEAETSQR
jgi:hypothetical protein